jgi:hypothetical protein
MSVIIAVGILLGLQTCLTIKVGKQRQELVLAVFITFLSKLIFAFILDLSPRRISFKRSFILSFSILLLATNAAVLVLNSEKKQLLFLACTFGQVLVGLISTIVEGMIVEQTQVSESSTKFLLVFVSSASVGYLAGT